MTDATPPTETMAALVVAERQLVLLGELTQMAIEVSRAFAASAKASAKAEERILADEYFVPEVGRARACGARDASESFQKASRAARLTMKLELAVAETVDDLRAGITTKKISGETPAFFERAAEPDRRRLASSSAANETPDRERYDSDRDCLVEFDRSDTLHRAPFREMVEEICDDLGATVNWIDCRIEAPALEPTAVRAAPPNTADPP